MKRVIKVLLDFLRLPVLEKTEFGSKVVKGLADNEATFKDLPIKTGELETLNSSLIAANNEVQSLGTPAAKSHLKTAEKEWKAGFKKTAIYVDDVAEGNKETIELSGFNPSKEETSQVVVDDRVREFFAEVTKGKKASFTSGCKPQNTAKAYAYIAADPDMQVTQVNDLITVVAGGKKLYLQVSTHREVEFAGVDSKQSLNVLMFSVNSAGSSPVTVSHEVTPQ